MDTTELQNQAIEIRDAENEGENTATKVGTLLVNIIQALEGIVTEESLTETLAAVEEALQRDYASLENGTVKWHQRGVIFLKSMGSALDNIDGGSYTPSYEIGDTWFNPTSGGLVHKTQDRNESWSVRLDAVYINSHTLRVYKWASGSMVELGSERNPVMIDYMVSKTVDSIAVGEVFWQSSNSKLVIKTGESSVRMFSPDPSVIYCARDTKSLMIWDTTTSTWQSVGGGVTVINDLVTGGEGDALSAEMGKELKEMIDSIGSIGSSTLGTGTFNEAWVRSQIDNSVFCWLLSDTIDGDTILKPIWHVWNGVFVDAVGAEVLIEASSVPASPTITINGVPATSGATIARNTQVVITPSSGSVLFYRQGSGAYNRSDKAVTLTMSASGTQVISAYCTNNKGNSIAVEVTLEVQGTPVPTFTPATSEVSRGGVVTIVGEAGGTLHYKIGDAATYTDVTGVGDAAPQATITIDGQTTDANRRITIHAYNTINGEDSGVVSKTYTMAALAAPTFSVESGTEFPADGGSVALVASQGATIYYTTDGSTPTTSSTQYASAIAVNSAMTIKAIAVDAYGSSEVASASYSVKLPKILVTTNGATTMSLGDTDLTAIPLESGDNEISIDDINTLAGTNYTSFADHVFPSLSFGDKMKIVSFDGGGVKINSLNYSFNIGSTGSPLKKVIGIVLAPIGATGASAISAFQNDYTNPVLSEIEISGEINGSMANFIATNSGVVTKLDLSGLTGTVTSASGAFRAYKGTVLDIKGLEINASSAYGMFRGLSNCTTLKIKKVTSSGTVTNMFAGTSKIKTLVSTNEEPYDAGWLADIGNGLTAIYVPDESVTAYQEHASWSEYSSIIQGISNYNE